MVWLNLRRAFPNGIILKAFKIENNKFTFLIILVSNRNTMNKISFDISVVMLLFR